MDKARISPGLILPLGADTNQVRIPSQEINPCGVGDHDGIVHSLGNQLVVTRAPGITTLGLHRQEVSLLEVTCRASGYDVVPAGLTTVETRQHVVQRQEASLLLVVHTTVLALVVVAQQDVIPAELHPTVHTDIILQHDNTGDRDGCGGRVDLPVSIFSHNLGGARVDLLDRFLPSKGAQRHHAQGQTVRVQYKSISHVVHQLKYGVFMRTPEFILE